MLNKNVPINLKKLNPLPSENSEQISFIHSSKRKRNYSSWCDKYYNNAQHGNPRDNILLDSISNVRTEENYSKKNSTFNASSENFEPGLRSESCFRRGGYKTKSSTTGILYQSSKRNTRTLPYDSTRYSSFIDTEFCSKSIENTSQNAHLDSSNISETSK
ncbi:hypothetical protein AVEN_44569-1 [Araneus ventricosus]|uniref:Uncharacterized protein n=1 Tax=Araneus ventricosus TaxID=182803 RepID=A0A4Y2TBC2_ARAVE|nr:hypothetical protein AVEN_44569-1 [Araneus ventricosus]